MDYFATDQLIEPERGDLLISEPYLPDPNFDRTVVYLCEHDENGTFGFVLNKQAQIKVSDVVDEVSYEADLFVGGPVQQDTLHYLHRDPILSESAIMVKNDIFWGGNYELLHLIHFLHQPHRHHYHWFLDKFFVMYPSSHHKWEWHYRYSLQG